MKQKKCKTCTTNIWERSTWCKPCFRKVQKSLLPKLEGWAKDYDSCLECGTTEREHDAKGLCYKCNHISKNNCVNCDSKITIYAKRCQPCNTKFNKGENHHMYGKKGELCHNYIPEIHDNTCPDCDKSISIYAKKCRSCASILTNSLRPKFDGWSKKYDSCIRCESTERLHASNGFCSTCVEWSDGNQCIDCDNKILNYTKRCMSCSQKGERSVNWKGGISFEPYTLDFNGRFKESIRERDNRCCLVCNNMEEELNSRLDVHHIDYVKVNSFPQNCASLCRVCHTRTNTNREHWKTFFQSLLKERYGYKYTTDQKVIFDFGEGLISEIVR